MTSRKHPSGACWATLVMVVVLLAYPLSYGPAGWLCTRFDQPELWNSLPRTVYAPVLWAERHIPAPISEAYDLYVNMCVNSGARAAKRAGITLRRPRDR